MNDRATPPAGPRGGIQKFEIWSEPLGPGRVRICCRGELDLATNPPLAERLEEAVTNGDRVLIDLHECGYIDSTAIGTLIGARRAVNGSGGRGAIVVLATEPPVIRVLELTGVGECLRLTEDPAEALRLLEQD
jgi:anti-sigma B factor antagonist